MTDTSFYFCISKTRLFNEFTTFCSWKFHILYMNDDVIRMNIRNLRFSLR
jgi:hypothetical protein